MVGVEEFLYIHRIGYLIDVFVSYILQGYTISIDGIEQLYFVSELPPVYYVAVEFSHRTTHVSVISHLNLFMQVFVRATRSIRQWCTP